MSIPGLAESVFNSEVIPNYATVPVAPVSIIVTQVASGVQAQRFERFVCTFVNQYGESVASPEVVVQIAAGFVAFVTHASKEGAGSYPGRPTGFNVYGTTGGSGTETLQNTATLTTGATWQEPATGLTTNLANPPTTASPRPALILNSGAIVDTPPATGSLVPPQSPSGAITTNTGRTTTATQTFLSRFNIS